MTHLIVQAMALALVAGSVSPASALLCQKRSGAVILRDACKRREVVVALADIVVPTPGPPGAAGAAGQPTARLLDATGVEVGPVLSLGSGSAVVLLDRAGLPAPIAILVNPGPLASGGVLWSGAACTGAPRIVANSGLPPHGEVLGDALYVPEGAVQTENLASQESAGPFACDPTVPGVTVTPRGTCCFTPPTGYPSTPVYGAREFSLTALGVTLPLRLVVSR